MKKRLAEKEAKAINPPSKRPIIPSEKQQGNLTNEGAVIHYLMENNIITDYRKLEEEFTDFKSGITSTVEGLRTDRVVRSSSRMSSNKIINFGSSSEDLISHVEMIFNKYK